MSPARADNPHAIAWHTDLTSARVEARDSQRLVWLQFTGPWCSNCRRLESESFVNSGVVDLAARHFVAVKLRADEHESLALRLGLSSLPATVILRYDGHVVSKSEGYLDVEDFTAFLQSSVKGHDSSPARRRPPTPELALSGYCPVSLVERHKLVKGIASKSATHDGQVYAFAGAAEQAGFLRDPEKYVPENGGQCPVLQLENGERRPGSARFGVLYKGHLYLCHTLAERVQFLKQPERYASVGIVDQGLCPHCRALVGLPRAGQPSISLTRGGVRYLFPDSSHREAYLSTTDTTRR